MNTRNNPPYYEALLDISQALNSIHDTDELLQRVMDIAIETMSAERGFIMLESPGTSEEFVTAVAHNIDPDSDVSEGSASQSVLQRVMEEQEPVMTHDAPQDERFSAAESIIAQHIQSILAVPLRIKGALIGVIYLDSTKNRTQFTPQGLRFMEAFANQAAIAIDNANLIQEKIHENIALRSQMEEFYPFEEIVGESPAMKKVFQTMEKVLDVDSPVLLLGESGTGKELVARAIHYQGHRKEKPFVAQFCGALTDTLLESELFGHKKGSFTGAASDKPGLFEIANGGTFFLDEIADIPLSTQTKLLRVLQEGELKRVGDTKSIHVDVRIISATNKDLKREVTREKFREDLFYRINVITIEMPPLRDRGDDVLLLADLFLNKYSKKLDRDVQRFSRGALRKLQEYKWPGNVRELENTIQRAITLCQETKIQEEHLGLFFPEEEKRSEEMTLDEVKKQHVLKVLEKHDGNRTRTAEALDVSLRWLQYQLKDWDEN